MIESVTPHFHDDRVADASGGSLLDRAILYDGIRRLVFQSLGLGGAADRPQTSLIHLRFSVQRHGRPFSKSRLHQRKTR
jgi:hypothetical protein